MNRKDAIGASTAFCPPAINQGLILANPETLGWRTTNEQQSRYFELYGMSGFDVKALSAYLDSTVTRDAQELKAWFAERGWDIDVSFPPDGLGIGSIFDLLVDWLVPGMKRDSGLTIDKVRYEAAEMRPSKGLRAHKLDGYKDPMFELATTKDGWKVYLVEADEQTDAFDLPAKAVDLLARGRKAYEFSKLIYPFVELEATVDVSWLEGLSAGDFRVDEAIKKVRMRLDDKGARAQSAFAMTTRGMDSGIYIVDKPFYVIFDKEGLNFPAFVAQSGPDSWVRRA